MAKLARKKSRSEAIKAGMAKAKAGRGAVAEVNTLFKMFDMNWSAYYETERRVEFIMFPFRIMGPSIHVEYFSRADHMKDYANNLISKRTTADG